MTYRRTGFGQESPVIPGTPGVPWPTTDTNPWKTLVIVSAVGAALWWLIDVALPKPRRRTRV